MKIFLKNTKNNETQNNNIDIILDINFTIFFCRIKHFEHII